MLVVTMSCHPSRMSVAESCPPVVAMVAVVAVGPCFVASLDGRRMRLGERRYVRGVRLSHGSAPAALTENVAADRLHLVCPTLARG